MPICKLLLLPGDGIGPEVMAEALKVSRSARADRRRHIRNRNGPGRRRRLRRPRRGDFRFRHGLASAADAVLLGAVGGPKWDGVGYDKRPEAGLFRLRKDLELFANLRPAVCYPALADASSLKREVIEGLDLMLVRELTGGIYFGEPKAIIELGDGQKRAVDTQIYDTNEIERVGRAAFELARGRNNKVTSCEKHNVMKTGVLWREVITALHAANSPT
jgi:3-isopropylmalate dehydrogenase